MKMDFSIKVLFICLSFLVTSVFAGPYLAGPYDLPCNSPCVSCETPCKFSRPCVGFYGGFNIGWTQIHEPSLLISLVPGDVNAALASVPGITFTEPGFSFTINSVTLNSFAINSFNTSQSNNLLGMSFFVGYKFYDYFALEGGIGKTQNFKNSYSANVNGQISGTGTFSGAGVSTPTTFTGNFTGLNRTNTLNTSWLYLVAKAILPISQSFDIFAKLGYTFLWQQLTSQVTIQNLTNVVVTSPPPFPATVTVTPSPDTTFSASDKSSRRKTYPILGLGGSYYFGSSSTVDVFWTRILVNTSAKDHNIDIYGIGVTSTF